MSKPTKYAFSCKSLVECMKTFHGQEISDRSAGAALDYFANHGQAFRTERAAAQAIYKYRRHHGKWPRLSEKQNRHRFDIASAKVEIDDMWYDRHMSLNPSLNQVIAALRRAGIKSITIA